MSSSANRRPRVAGQRRRPVREDDALVGDDQNLDAESEPGEESIPEVDADVVTEDPTADDTGALDAGALDQANPAVDPDEADGEAHDDVDEEGTTGDSTRSLLLPAIAFAVCLALLATVLFVTRADPGERPRAASAATATARSTLEQILSYNYSTMAQQLPASQALLTGTFRQEFGETMTKTIVPLAEKDKTVVKARVYEAGVMKQSGNSVTVQAFVNQARTSDTQKEPSIDQNRVIATMTKSGDRWLVSALKAY